MEDISPFCGAYVASPNFLLHYILELSNCIVSILSDFVKLSWSEGSSQNEVTDVNFPLYTDHYLQMFTTDTQQFVLFSNHFPQLEMLLSFLRKHWMRTGSRDPQSSYVCVEFDIFENFIAVDLSFISDL